MTPLAVIALLVGGATALSGVLIWAFGKVKYDQGAAEQRNAEQAEADAAKDRANDVLSEQRDPDDATARLRDHNF